MKLDVLWLFDKTDDFFQFPAPRSLQTKVDVRTLLLQQIWGGK